MTDNFFKADSRNLPKLNNASLVEFIASSPNHNVAEIRGAKILMSSRESYLNSAVGYVQISRTGSVCTVKARIVPEHRVNNKPYSVICKIDEGDESIIDSVCEDCAASSGGCKHSLLILFWLVKKSSEPPSTSIECYWNKPTLSSARTDHVRSKDIFPKEKKPVLRPKDPSILSAFYDICQQKQIKDSLIVKFNMDITKDLSMNIFDLMLSFIDENLVHDYQTFKPFLLGVVSETIIQMIAEKTEGQNDCQYWHNIRQGRLTASRLYEAAHCKTDGALVQQILGGYKVPQTKAIKRGIKLERAVQNEIEKKINIKITKSGFVLVNGILGASPDGITDDFVIEIKCPASNKAIQTYIKNGKIQNKFKTQIQCQMLACGKKKGLFCVADPLFESTKKLHLVWENFDKEYIENVISLGEVFWKTYIFPKILKSALTK